MTNGIEPIMDLQCQEYLTFSKAAVLMGCTRQYVYKLVANGKLKASRLSSRMAFVRKADIERMFESNPYKQQTPYWRILRHSRWPQQHHGMGDCRWGGDCLFYEQDSTSGIHLSPQDTYQAWVWSHLLFQGTSWRTSQNRLNERWQLLYHRIGATVVWSYECQHLPYRESASYKQGESRS